MTTLLRLLICTCFLSPKVADGQTTSVGGMVVDANTNQRIIDVQVSIIGSQLTATTDRDGLFSMMVPVAWHGEQVLLLSKQDYLPKQLPIVINQGQKLNLDAILLEYDISKAESRIGQISLSDAELDLDRGEVFNVAPMLQASKDAFLTAAAYDFSAAFFRPRGLDNAYGKLLINGVEMNKIFDGRPQWANWGGLNDAQRQRQFSMGLKPNPFSFGGPAGTTNISMRASAYSKGGRLSMAMANRTYQGRIMGTYASGKLLSGWSYAISLGRRFGTEAIIEGNGYVANSFFVAVEKQLNPNHSLNLTAIHTPNRRGRSAAVTQEVTNLRGATYNPNWGMDKGKQRNSRVRTVVEPLVMLNHYWDISDNTRLNTNLAYQFGKRGTSRIDHGGTRLLDYQGQQVYLGGGRNPLANYYQRLPSYFLRNPNPGPYHYQLAYQAAQHFVNDGQLDWPRLYRANQLTLNRGGHATYVLQQDCTDDKQLTINSLLSAKLGRHFSLNTGLAYRRLSSDNYAMIEDLLGGSGFLDIDFFAEDDVNLVVGDLAQSDLQHPNRVATQGERYKYNYELSAGVLDAFVQGEYQGAVLDGYLAVEAGQTAYERNGIYENGHFPGPRSVGPSDGLGFTNFGVKTGGTYKAGGGHFMNINLAYLSQAPSLRNSFANPRQNNDLVEGLTNVLLQAADLSYHYRTAKIKVRLSGYYNNLANRSSVAYYFTENISGLGIGTDAFIQEVTTDMDTRHLGAELGLEIQIQPSLKLRLAGAIGEYKYTNNPKLYISSDDFPEPIRFGDGRTNLKGYRVAAGPQQAYNMALEYRDPSYWWLTVSANRFSQAFIDVNKLARTANFYTDYDGLPINDYDSVLAEDLLLQEEIPAYYLLSLAGGSTWRLGSYLLGFFGTVGNVLNMPFKTGGFQQGRYATYRDMLRDGSRVHGALFGPRYFHGLGTNFFLNLYLRF